MTRYHLETSKKFGKINIMMNQSYNNTDMSRCAQLRSVTILFILRDELDSAEGALILAFVLHIL